MKKTFTAILVAAFCATALHAGAFELETVEPLQTDISHETETKSVLSASITPRTFLSVRMSPSEMLTITGQSNAKRYTMLPKTVRSKITKPSKKSSPRATVKNHNFKPTAERFWPVRCP